MAAGATLTFVYMIITLLTGKSFTIMYNGNITQTLAQMSLVPGYILPNSTIAIATYGNIYATYDPVTGAALIYTTVYIPPTAPSNVTPSILAKFGSTYVPILVSNVTAKPGSEQLIGFIVYINNMNSRAFADLVTTLGNSTCGISVRLDVDAKTSTTPDVHWNVTSHGNYTLVFVEYLFKAAGANRFSVTVAACDRMFDLVDIDLGGSTGLFRIDVWTYVRVVARFAEISS